MTPDISQLVPHRGAMSLLDRVCSHAEESIEALATVRPDSPFCDEDGVGAWVGIEYMAQAVAAWSGLRAQASGEAPRIGLLVGCRSCRSHVDSFAPGTALRIRAERRFEADNGLANFDCSIRDAHGAPLAEAVLTVFQPADPAAVLGEAAP